MEENGNQYKVLIENLKERDTRKTRYMWKDNNKMDLIEIG
jgi:hypothetical protein